MFLEYCKFCLVTQYKFYHCCPVLLSLVQFRCNCNYTLRMTRLIYHLNVSSLVWIEPLWQIHQWENMHASSHAGTLLTSSFVTRQEALWYCVGNLMSSFDISERDRPLAWLSFSSCSSSKTPPTQSSLMLFQNVFNLIMRRKICKQPGERSSQANNHEIFQHRCLLPSHQTNIFHCCASLFAKSLLHIYVKSLTIDSWFFRFRWTMRPMTPVFTSTGNYSTVFLWSNMHRYCLSLCSCLSTRDLCVQVT